MSNQSFIAQALLMSLLLAQAAAAQSLSWSQTPAGYGYGYVGSPVNTPVQSYYRQPPVYAYGYRNAAPVVAYSAPVASPQLATSTYYAPVANYPPRTVFPNQHYAMFAPATAYATHVVNRPVTYNVAPAMYTPSMGYGYYPGAYSAYAPTANYATGAFYRTNYARTPVTYYRPVLVMDPYTGGTSTVLQPQTGYEWQARRNETYRVFPFFNRTPAPAGWSPTGCYGSGCQSCASTGATNAQPYYVPAPNTGTVWPNSAPTYSTPSYGTPSYTTPGSTTIAPPSSFTPPNVSAPSSNVPLNNPPLNPNVPANNPPSLNPGDYNSGPTRRDYPPPVDSYSVPLESSSKYIDPRSSEPLSDWNRVPFSRSSDGRIRSETSLTEESRIVEPRVKLPAEPADEAPSLLGPSNGTSEARSSSLRSQRELPVTPIPDLESSGLPKREVQLQPKTAPQLLRMEDRTAVRELNSESVQLVRFQHAMPAKGNASLKPAAVSGSSYRVLGDDAWQPAGK